jgi:hypothetical protein
MSARATKTEIDMNVGANRSQTINPTLNPRARGIQFPALEVSAVICTPPIGSLLTELRLPSVSYEIGSMDLTNDLTARVGNEMGNALKPGEIKGCF